MHHEGCCTEDRDRKTIIELLWPFEELNLLIIHLADWKKNEIFLITLVIGLRSAREENPARHFVVLIAFIKNKNSSSNVFQTWTMLT